VYIVCEVSVVGVSVVGVSGGLVLQPDGEMGGKQKGENMLRPISELLEFDYKDVDITCPKCKATFKAGEMLIKTELLRRPGSRYRVVLPEAMSGR
jgi:hypothetical protein